VVAHTIGNAVRRGGGGAGVGGARGAAAWGRGRGGGEAAAPGRSDAVAASENGPSETLEDWCPAHGREYLLEEWDEPVRGAHEVTRASAEKVWWKCGKEECGHRWRAQVGSRTKTRGTGCPACAGRVPTATHNFEVYCQETGREELLGEWADRGRRPRTSRRRRT